MRDQVTGMTYSDGTPAVTMSYDAAGRPLEIGNAVATDAYSYDDAGQLAVETQSVAGHPAAMRTLTHSHDADGLRTGPPSHFDANPRSDRFRCAGCESKFLQRHIGACTGIRRGI